MASVGKALAIFKEEIMFDYRLEKTLQLLERMHDTVFDLMVFHDEIKASIDDLRRMKQEQFQEDRCRDTW